MKTIDLILDLSASVEKLKAQGNVTIPISELETYLNEIARIISAQESVSAEEPQRTVAARKFEHDFEVWKVQASLQNTSNLEMFKSVTEAGQAALKSAIIINGGAALALLAFVGNLMALQTEDAPTFELTGIGSALLVFLLGVGAAGLSSGISYLVQASYASGWRQLGKAMNWITIGLGFASFLAFFVGSIWTYLAVVTT